MLIAGAIMLVLAYFYLDTSDTLFGVVEDKFTKVDWDQVKPRDIVKNSIPIELLETNGSSCKVSGETFFMIIDHPYFVKYQEVSDQLEYDKEEGTLIVPCEQLQGEKSRLNVWYVVEESPVHSMKWEYFITDWNEEVP